MLIVPGTDYLSTDYSDIDLLAGGIRGPIAPAAFEFPNIGVVEFEGKPVGPGNTDTVRKRLEPIHLPYPGAAHAIKIEWTVVSIGSRVPVELNGKKYHVSVKLTPGKRSLGRMEVLRSNDSTVQGGIFYSSVHILCTATFVGVDNPQDTMSIDDEVLMATNQAGRWGVQPHRADARILSDQAVRPEDANQHANLRPDMYDFYQLGGVFEGQPQRGGMVSMGI